MESVSRPRFRVGGSPLDGNWFECPEGDECSHEGPGPWPTSRSTQCNLSRSVDESSYKRDEVVAKSAGYDHRFGRGDLTKVARLADEVMGENRMGKPCSIGMKLTRGDVFHTGSLFEIFDGEFNPCSVPVQTDPPRWPNLPSQ